MKYSPGQKVYLPQLDTIGIVESVNEAGQPVTIKVGDRILKAIDYVIKHTSTLIMILSWIRKFFNKQPK